MDFFDKERVADLGVRVDRQGRIPDVILGFGRTNGDFLVESVASRELIDGNRHGELNEQFGGAHTGIVYIHRLSGSYSGVAS